MGPLPRRCRPARQLVAVVTAVEFCVVYFGAELVHASTGVALAGAAALMSLFYVGELVGRIGGAWLTRTTGRAPVLLLGSLAVTATGFVALWWSPPAIPTAISLFVTGVGVANLYPLALALAVACAPGRMDEAAARTQLGVGLAVLAAPLAVGALADRVGVLRAFAVEPVLIGMALVLLAVGRRDRRYERRSGQGRRGTIRRQAEEAVQTA